MASSDGAKKSNKEKYTVEDLRKLGNDLLSSISHINNLPILLSFISPSTPHELALESFISLQSFFIPVVPEILSKPERKKDGLRDSSDPEVVYRLWIRSKFDEFVSSTINLTVSDQTKEALRELGLDAIMDFVKLGKDGKFKSSIYHKFLRNLVYSTSGVEFLVNLLTNEFFKYIDVRSVELVIHNVHSILSHIPPLEAQDGETNYEMWSEAGLSSPKVVDRPTVPELLPAEEKGVELKKYDHDVSSIIKKMKSKFNKTWLSFLRLSLPLDIYKEVLATLHQSVIPHIGNPVILCDFLTRSYDIGGVISVMALSSLFILMTQYGLEYPNFYKKLYALLVPSMFMAKYRSKFFQLLDLCLKSTLIPAYLAAGFAKKLSRLSLFVPPSGALVIIAIIHNILRRHPSINFLVHQPDHEENGDDNCERDDSIKGPVESNADQDIKRNKLGIDPFDSEENDPAKCNAMRSSLWEIDDLRRHYCPAVSRFVLSLENDLTVRAKTTEMLVKDFSSASYATIFNKEIRRRLSQYPLAFYKSLPNSLFSDSDSVGWSFQSEHNEEIDITKDSTQNSRKRQRVESS